MTGGLVVWSLLAAGAPATALAQSPSPGVHVDPGSPAAKQYAIPLATARGAPPGAGTPSTLFGQGITSATSGTQSTATSSTGSASSLPRHAGKAAAHRPHPTGQGRTARRRVAIQQVSTPPALKVLHPGSGSGAVWMIGLAGLVIVLGSAGGVLAAGRMRRGSPRAG
jgi:hypothetical protein